MSTAVGLGTAVTTPRRTLRHRLADRGLDRTLWLVLPATAFVVVFFIYPFIYGLELSFQPLQGGAFSNYHRFFADPYLRDTIWKTLRLAIPATVLNVVLSVPIAMPVRLMRRQRLLTTILVLPITLGTVLIAEGLLNYLGPQGWLNRTLMTLHLVQHPVRMVHNYTGVFLSLIISGFPFTFLLTLSYTTGIDPSLENAAATLGAGRRARFRYVILPLLAQGLAIAFCLTFVQMFSVFPSAVLLGEPAGTTRVISVAAYTAAYEDYDYSMASAIAMIMGAVQLIIVALVLGARGLLYRGPSGGGKG